jgi:hypothetical protein
MTSATFKYWFNGGRTYQFGSLKTGNNLSSTKKSAFPNGDCLRAFSSMPTCCISGNKSYSDECNKSISAQGSSLGQQNISRYLRFVTTNWTCPIRTSLRHDASYHILNIRWWSLTLWSLRSIQRRVVSVNSQYFSISTWKRSPECSCLVMKRS